MNHTDDLDDLVTAAIDDQMRLRAPGDLFDRVRDATQNHPQRPPWLARATGHHLTSAASVTLRRREERPVYGTFRLAAALVAVAIVAIVGFAVLGPRGDSSAGGPSARPSPSASPSGETDTADLVTEEVEPGVERIKSDGAGHDLEERHPTFRYDMDDVYVTPDGTVWLSSTYSGTDNEANPPGGLVWALGQSETSQYPAAAFCFPGAPNQPQALGVTCFKGDTPTRYLADTRINAVAAAPDGTFWAVGSDGAENGGLYHITPE